ncbi:MAG TPA: sigma-70 family RNA polymerase sigma factor [Solirubrobacteraceae bacterium]|nr:sigma-70 family RNA polymerase sigma factor [Solirubrobacteraceae bacterium]
MTLFRAGHDEAFRVIHDRYRQRLFAYTRQMLNQRQDAEDALQDIFIRAYAGLRASDRELALRAWLYRVAHNRCIDQLRRPSPPPPEVMELLRSPVHDPIAEADRRESLRRLIADVRRLPDQQRSALLMRELGGMSYADLSAALGVTIPAVKSLLVRARLALAQALEARDTACSEIREELILSHDRGLRPNATARRHMRDCAGCREFRHDLRGVSRSFAAIVPTLGPLGVLANVLGLGGAGAGSGAAGGIAAAGGAAGSGTAIVSVGAMSAGATHVATLLAAAVVTAGGAVELQHTLPAPAHHVRHARVVHHASPPAAIARFAQATSADSSGTAPTASTPVVTPPTESQLSGVPPASAKASSTSSATQTASSTSTTITTVTVDVKPQATGGISTVVSPGGASPSKPVDSAASTTDGSAKTSTTTSTTGSPAATGTDSTQTGQTTSGSTSSSQEGSATSTTPTSSDPSTGSSQATSSGTGSSTGAGTGGTPSPAQ